MHGVCELDRGRERAWARWIHAGAWRRGISGRADVVGVGQLGAGTGWAEWWRESACVSVGGSSRRERDGPFVSRRSRAAERAEDGQHGRDRVSKRDPCWGRDGLSGAVGGGNDGRDGLRADQLGGRHVDSLSVPSRTDGQHAGCGHRREAFWEHKSPLVSLVADAQLGRAQHLSIHRVEQRDCAGRWVRPAVDERRG